MLQQVTTLPELPSLPRDAHKGVAGRLLCLCGSESMPGAAQLVTRSALRGGAGLVTLASADASLRQYLAECVPEVIHLDLQRVQSTDELLRTLDQHDHQVRVLGPGLGQSEQTSAWLQALPRSRFSGAQVWDADALNGLGAEPARLADCQGPVILTPHPGEARRLLGRDIPADADGRLACATDLAHLTRGICVLKGEGTVVTDGERFFRCASGNPGMATAGSGDVLTGLIGAYLLSARWPGVEWGAFEAACLGVDVHSAAGDRVARSLGERALVASDLIDALGAVQLDRTEGVDRL